MQLIYAFGSRAGETLALVDGRITRLSEGPSDVDIGVKPRRPLTVERKVEIGILFEDLFEVPRVDLVVVSEVSVFLALQIVTGELPLRRSRTQVSPRGEAAPK
ncbi:MAG: nucleotidyltransferase domain-containing protein [Planctomycetota bacterium]